MERDEPRHRDLSGLARPSALAPFRIRNYRFQWPADLLTSWGFEMETLILGWYMLAETGSVLLLTLFAALAYTGALIAPPIGMIGDRIGHRNLLAIMRATYVVVAALQLLLVLTGHLNPFYVMGLAAITGLVRPSDMGVRGVLVVDIMPPDQLIGATSVSRATSDTARIAGALSGAGLFAALGMGPAYVAIVILYFASTVLTLCIVPSSRPRPDANAASAPRPSPLRDLKEGIAHVWTSPRMRAAVWIAFLTNLTAYPLTNGLLPYVARDIFGTDQSGLGYLSAGYAVGSLSGSIALSFVGRIQVARLMITSAVVWYSALLIFAQMNTLPAAIGCLMLAGFSQSLTMIALSVVLMRAASEHFRGVVMGVRMMVIYSLPLGLIAAGSLIDLIGYAATGTLYAAAGLALLMAIALHWRADLWHVHAPANAR